MTAVIKRPGKAPEKIEIEGDLRSLQIAVGGHIEHYGFCRGIGMLCNEEWRLLGLPFNFIFDGDVEFGGPVLFVGEKNDEFTGLSDEQLVAVGGFFGIFGRRL